MARKDGLRAYREKRNFGRSPEPRGKRARGRKEPRFVIQKHAARSVHYDFRLEADGVLRSWAVPKGPSTDPREKRLAMPTEDHPLDYAVVWLEGEKLRGGYALTRLAEGEERGLLVKRRDEGADARRNPVRTQP